MTDKNVYRDAIVKLRQAEPLDTPETGLDFFKGLAVALLLAFAFYGAAFAVAATWWR